MTALRAKTNAEWIAAFKETAGAVADEEWAGELIDLFSPDYMSKERQPWERLPKGELEKVLQPWPASCHASQPFLHFFTARQHFELVRQHFGERGPGPR